MKVYKNICTNPKTSMLNYMGTQHQHYVVEYKTGKSQQAGTLALMGTPHQQQATLGLQQEISQELGMRTSMHTVEYKTGKSQQAGTLASLGTLHTVCCRRYLRSRGCGLACCSKRCLRSGSLLLQVIQIFKMRFTRRSDGCVVLPKAIQLNIKFLGRRFCLHNVFKIQDLKYDFQ